MCVTIELEDLNGEHTATVLRFDSWPEPFKRCVMQSVSSVVHSDPDILSGIPVFVGTRVPAKTLIDYPAGGHPLGDFLEDFPSVSQEQAIAMLQLVAQTVVADACAA